MKIYQRLVIATTIGTVSYTVIAMSTPAQAAQLFNFNYSLPGINSNSTPVIASGVLTTDPDPQTGTYTITGINGTRNGEQILSLLSPYSYEVNDNILNSSEPFLTSNGLSYEVSGAGDDGQGDVNVYFNLSGYTEFSSNVSFGSFIVSPVPEPNPLSLGSTIVAGGMIAWSLKRKKSIL